MLLSAGLCIPFVLDGLTESVVNYYGVSHLIDCRDYLWSEGLSIGDLKGASSC